MTRAKKKTIIASIELYMQSLLGKNYSLKSIEAYLSDLAQFLEWLKTRRVDYDILYRIQWIDIVEFISH
jgi:site-specific recombinase XerD